MPKKAVIEKYTTDKPRFVPFDPDKPGVMVIRHDPSGKTIKSWGWSLNEVLAKLGWKDEHVWCSVIRPFGKYRQAIDISPGIKPVPGLDKLNKAMEVE